MFMEGISLGISFLVMLLISPKGIKLLHQLKFGQEGREDGPNSHLKKQGTPTMGGILFLIAISVACLPFAGTYPHILPAYLLGMGFGVVGFIDDYLKVVKHQSEGFNPKQKMLCQTIISILYISYIFYSKEYSGAFRIPFFGKEAYSVGLVLFFPISLFIITATDTGANFTDGIDGLCSSVTGVIVFFLLLKNHLGTGDMAPLMGAVLGGLLGFLCFNAYPAKVFMGDTGSLALGGFVASYALMCKIPVFIAVIGFIYMIEVISVIIQVGYFKSTKGKRFFKMAPIHHHFELCGWSETRTVTVFSIITIILGVMVYLFM